MDTSHLSAQACILARSAFRASAVLIGLPTMTKILVSSAKSLMQVCISSTISLIYMKKVEDVKKILEAHQPCEMPKKKQIPEVHLSVSYYLNDDDSLFSSMVRESIL